MESLWNHAAGPNGDSLPRPEGLDRWAVLRALDRERIAEEAPELPRERVARIARLRDEIRRGVYETPERLAAGIARALADAERPRRRP